MRAYFNSLALLQLEASLELVFLLGLRNDSHNEGNIRLDLRKIYMPKCYKTESYCRQIRAPHIFLKYLTTLLTRKRYYSTGF